MVEQVVIEMDGKDRVHYEGPMVFADVNESTAIAVERRGQFRELLMQNTGKNFDAAWKIVDAAPGFESAERKKFFGGLQYVGIRPLDDVKHYKLRWKTSKMEDKEGVFKFYNKELWYVNLKPSLLYMVVVQAETSPTLVQGKSIPERIPVDVEILYNCIVTNPFMVLYKAPGYWIEKAEEYLSAVLAGWIGTKTLDELYSIRAKSSQQLWDEIKNDPLFVTLKGEWGWLITDIKMKSVTPPKEIQEAGMKAAEEAMKADADIQDTVVKWRKMVAVQIGLTSDEVQQMLKDKFDDFRENYGEVADQCWKMIVLQTELKSKARFHFENEGGSGPEGWIALLSALGAFGGGKGGGDSEAKKGEGKGKTKKSVYPTTEDAINKQFMKTGADIRKKRASGWAEEESDEETE
jgi:hypothetical protein